MTNEEVLNQVDTYLAQIAAHLKEGEDAVKELKREAKLLRRIARRGQPLEFDTIQARVYNVGSAFRWFLHPLAPLRDPSPGLASDEAAGRKGEHPTEGVV